MRETSLDEFLGGDDGSQDSDGRPDDTEEGEEEEDADVESVQAEEEDEPQRGAEAESEVELAGGTETEQESEAAAEPDREPDAVEPAVSTYDWTPTSADCEACGTAVERRWRDDGRLVCADCKAW